MSTVRNFFLSHSNPVLQRELRVTLRNVRTFMLLAIYVALLGAIVLVQFPADTTINMPAVSKSFTGTQSTAALGRNLFWTFMGAQMLLVWALIPLLATGTLAQERERHTLEPLLLSPLTPLQIVWGKAVGILALTLLMLCGTLPLTSLAFLLGGVSPGELAGGYCILLALAFYFTGVGLYASARYQNSVRAVLWCYAVLAMSVPLLILAVTFGAIFSGLAIAAATISVFWRTWRSWAPAKLRRLSPVWHNVLGILILMVLGGSLLLLISNPDVGQFVIYGVFVAPCVAFLALFPMQRAAAVLAKSTTMDLPLPAREWAQNLQNEWQQAVAPQSTSYLPSPTGKYTYTPQTPTQPAFASVHAPTASSISQESPQAHHTGGVGGATSRSSVPTYGVKAFLSDKMNPVFAREMRSGLGGKFDYLFRYSYVITIATELLLIFYLMPTAANLREATWFFGLGRLHLFALMVAGAWLGARAIAPEREKQILPQILTTPLTAATIIKGKMMTVAVYTFYIFVLFLPLALILPMLGLLSWQATLYFLVVELICGTLAASWGLFCSLQGITARRALGLGLGGILLTTVGGGLVSGSLYSLLQGYLIGGSKLVDYIEVARNLISPLTLLNLAPSRTYAPYGIVSKLSPGMAQVTVLTIYFLLAVFFLVMTARSFRTYSRSL